MRYCWEASQNCFRCNLRKDHYGRAPTTLQGLQEWPFESFETAIRDPRFGGWEARLQDDTLLVVVPASGGSLMVRLMGSDSETILELVLPYRDVDVFVRYIVSRTPIDGNDYQP